MGVALITPFNEDDSIDFDALGRLVDYQLHNKTDYLVVLGTTAETPTLSDQEKIAIKDFVIQRVNGRLPIVLGVGGNCTRSLVHQLETNSYDGISALLSVTPYYNKPSQEGLYQHYKALSAATINPSYCTMFPVVPGKHDRRNHLAFSRECANIVAVKEASGNIVQVNEIIKRSLPILWLFRAMMP